ncbi:MAG TPA: hypothetical protein VM597_02430, partial [Gemmataceae bacterium]|nr:hypothetical protein [Gemmataceae bacterium]
VSGWAVNAAGTNGGANDQLRTANPNAGLTIGTAATNLVQDLGGGQLRVRIPGVSSLTDGLLLVVGGKNEDNYSLARANADGSWQVYTKDNGTNTATTGGYEQDYAGFVYLPRDMPNVVSGRIMGDGTVQMPSGNFTLTKSGVGTYTLNVPGQSPTTGILLLSPEGGVAGSDDNFTNYQASGSDFVIQHRDVVSTTAAPVLEDVPATTPVASFAFIPFLATPAVRTTSVQSTTGTAGQSDLGAAVTVNPDGTVSYDPTPSATIQGMPAGAILTDTFRYTTTSLTGQTTSATVTVRVADGSIVDLVNGKLTVEAGPGQANAVAVSTVGGNITLSDTAATFALTQAAIDAGFTGGGTNAITGPAAAVTELAIDLGDGADTIAASTVGNIPLTITADGSLTTAGVLTAAGPVTLVAPTLGSTATGLIAAPTVTLTGTTVGTTADPVRTQADTIAVTVGAGGAAVLEADGAAVSGTATGGGDFSVANALGTLTVAGPVETDGGDIALASADAVVLAATVDSGLGTIAIAANTDGAGAEGLTQTAGSVVTANFSATAATLTVNTAAGGTGDASIDSTAVGGASGGTLVVNSHAGSVLYAGAEVMTDFQRGVIGNGGSAPARLLRAGAYRFTGAGIGTDDRPMQSDNLGPNDTGLFAAGAGGVYWTDWGSVAFGLAGATATGAGNVRVVTANADSHNLNVTGPVTAEAGSIFLAADDNYALTAPVGGAGFSGTVYMAGNRDTGNTANMRMNAGASITTSNAGPNAVYLESFNNSGTRAGGLTLNNITTGDGGTITATTVPVAVSQGSILAFDAAAVLNVGPTGRIVLITAPQTGTADSIGTAALPLRVAGGTVIASTTASTTSNGTIFITGDGATGFAATVAGTGTNAGAISLATTGGVLTVAGPTQTVNAGAITLTSTGTNGGVTISDRLGDANTGPVTINAGANPATLNTTYALPSTLNLAVTAANGLEVVANGTLAGTGASGNATPVTGRTGGTVSPAGTSTGTLNLGNLALGAGSTLRADLNGTAAFDAVTTTGTVDVTGATLNLLVNATFAVNDGFTLIANDGADAVVGQFAGGTTVRATNDPRYEFTINYAGGDGNDVVATVTNVIAATLLDVSPAGVVTFSSADALTNNLTVTRTADAVTITDTAGVIQLTAAAVAAGWTGTGTNTVTGPTAGVTGLVLLTNTGTDTLAGIDTGSIPVTVAGTATVAVGGLVTSTASVTLQGADVTGAGTVLSPVVTLTASNGVGTSAQRLTTTAGTVTAAAGAGGLFLAETDGADLAATTTGSGPIDVVNAAGTLNLTATSASGAITAAATAGTLNAVAVTSGSGNITLASADLVTVPGAVTSATGNVTLTSANSVTVEGTVNAGTGTIAIAANTDGVGAEGYDQKAGSIVTANRTAGAASITVNTPAGGTGDAILGRGSVGGDIVATPATPAGGGLTVASNGGNIRWSEDPFYTAFGPSQTGLGNGGNNAQTLRAYSYHFTTGPAGAVGTTDRPLQLDNYGTNGGAGGANPDPNLTAAAGAGGMFATVWDTAGNHDLTVGNVSAQGAGDIRIVAA